MQWNPIQQQKGKITDTCNGDDSKHDNDEQKKLKQTHRHTERAGGCQRRGCLWVGMKDMGMKGVRSKVGSYTTVMGAYVKHREYSQ